MNPKYDILSIEWEFEDNLPKNLSDIEFDHLFYYSEIKCGVRMYPFITLYDDLTGECKRIYLGA